MLCFDFNKFLSTGTKNKYKEEDKELSLSWFCFIWFVLIFWVYVLHICVCSSCLWMMRNQYHILTLFFSWFLFFIFLVLGGERHKMDVKRLIYPSFLIEVGYGLPRVVNGPGRASPAHFYLAYRHNGLGIMCY